MKQYLKKEKWGIIIFLIGFVLGGISSYLLIGGPATIEGPIGVFLGFCLIQFSKYRSFKKMEAMKGIYKEDLRGAIVGEKI